MNFKEFLKSKFEKKEFPKNEIQKAEAIFQDSEGKAEEFLQNYLNNSFSEFKKLNFPKINFKKGAVKKAGSLFKKERKDEALKCLQEALNIDGPSPYKFKPPAWANVIAKSRDFSQFDIIKASEKIQEKIYNSKHSDFEQWDEEGFLKKEKHTSWFEQTGVNTDFKHVSCLNMIFKNALATYKGVIVKVEKRNKKNKKRAERDSRLTFVEEFALNDGGYLKQKPGINPNIYCINDCNVRPLTQTKLKQLIMDNPNNLELKRLEQYNYEPANPIPIYGLKHRQGILKGEPGYIPIHHRVSLNPSKRSRRYWKSNDEKLLESLMVVAEIPQSKDWVICDVRGLLRNVRYRKLLVKNVQCSLNDLMKFFTKDPIIDTTSGIVAFSYVEGKVPIYSLKPISGGKTKEYIEESLKNDDVCIAGIDLGVINTYAVGIFKMLKNNSSWDDVEMCGKFATLSSHIAEWNAYKARVDALEIGLNQESILNLSDEHKSEFDKVSCDDVKGRIINHFQLPRLSWSNMKYDSTQISDYLESVGRKVDAYLLDKDGNPVKDKNKKIKYKSDLKWYKEFKLKVSKEARDAQSNSLWDLKRSSPEFKKLSKSKAELARKIVNYIVKTCKEKSGCDKVMLAIEDLSRNNKNAKGKGYRGVGWDNFGVPKKEGRWFMQALGKALLEQCKHHDIPVLIANKAYTSQTCPACGYCDENNRSNDDREKFKCLKCNKEYNSDVDVATFNIAKVASTGKRLPGPLKSEKVQRRQVKKYV